MGRFSVKRQFVALVIAAGLAAGPCVSSARAAEADLSLARQAVAAAKRDQADEAIRLARQAPQTVLPRLVAWIGYASGRSEADFARLATFITSNPDWPLLAQLTRSAEDSITLTTPAAEILRWFDSHPPTTANGAIAYARVLTAQGRADAAAKVVRDAWVGLNFGAAQERQFLDLFGMQLRPEDHWRRLDRLLWERREEPARAMLPRVDPGRRAVALARLALQGGKASPEPLIAQVPGALRDDPGLVYERVRWRRIKEMDEEAIDLLAHPACDKVRPDLWWQERAILVRRALQHGWVSRAYQLAAEHELQAGSAYVDAEFLAGWIALRFLDDRETALLHFLRLHEWATHPMSRARAAYWAGRAYDALGDAKARDWYSRAARHSTTYYGQLAAARLKGGLWALPDEPVPTAEDSARFESREVVAAARLLLAVGEDDLLRPFFIRLNDIVESPGERVLVARLALAAGREDLAVTVARRSERDGVVLLEAGWPLPDFAARPDTAPEKPLVLALIRQESGFMADAQSPVGARGLMQLMPATATQMARSVGVPYAAARLDDPAYNIRLGSAYLSSLIDRFGGSYLLAVASYNAGPGRARRWMRENGDPREESVDVVDWVEMITISETRNYVQRVLESVEVYRRRLGLPPGPGIEADLRRRIARMPPADDTAELR